MKLCMLLGVLGGIGGAFGCGTGPKPCTHADLGFRLTGRYTPPGASSGNPALPGRDSPLPGFVRVTVHNPGDRARAVVLACGSEGQVERVPVLAEAGTETELTFVAWPNVAGGRFSCEMQ